MTSEIVVTIDGEPPLAVGIDRDVVVLRSLDELGQPKGPGIRMSASRARAFIAALGMAIERLARRGAT